MVLVDTSIWISYLRGRNAQLRRLLQEAEVICHPFIIGELACGHIRNRREVLSLLQALPEASMADHREILYFIEYSDLSGAGIGLIDVHLLASARMTKVPLWTADRRLKGAADHLGISYGGR